MRNKFFFALPILLIAAACGSDINDKNEETIHPALLNPAVRPLTEAIMQDSSNASLYFKRAEMLHKIEMEDLTLMDLKNAVRLEPQNENFRVSLATLLTEVGKDEAALNEIKILKQQNPSEINYSLMEVAALRTGNKIDLAQPIIDQLLKENGNNPYVILEASKLKEVAKDTSAAIDFAKQLVKIAPGFYDGVYQLADLFGKQKNKEAIVWYQRLYNMDTLNAYPFYDIAKYYQSINDTINTKKYLIKAIMVDRDFVNAYLDYGALLTQEDSLEKAGRQFQIASQVSPANAEAYYGKGLVALKQGKTTEAKSFFEQALIFNGKHEASILALKGLK